MPPVLVSKPARVAAAGTKPKLIDEYIGRVNTETQGLSVAHMRSPGGWVEPGQTPDFDEYTVVLHGTLRVESQDGAMDVQAGQHGSSRSRPHHPDPPLQPFLHLLQRVRRFFQARPDRRDATGASTVLAALGTSIISFSGGEPLLHPDLDDLIRRIRKHGAIAGMITNGYLLTADRIQR
jgi:hypothetical protein